MHIGLAQSSEPPSTASSSMVKSVGQRLKDASCRGKEFENGGTAITNGAATNGTCAKGALKHQQNGVERTLRTHQPVILSELQKNTVRVIGQYLRELGMQ
jgi:hypothetical protein